jgi:hypothetical protein
MLERGMGMGMVMGRGVTWSGVEVKRRSNFPPPTARDREERRHNFMKGSEWIYKRWTSES